MLLQQAGARYVSLSRQALQRCADDNGEAVPERFGSHRPPWLTRGGLLCWLSCAAKMRDRTLRFPACVVKPIFMKRIDQAEESIELPDLDAARREAIVIIRKAAAEMMRNGTPVDDHVMVISDEDGLVVEKIAFRDVVLRS